MQKSIVRELKVLKKLRHDNIVQLKECFRRKGKLYLVFEYVEKNLLQLLEENPEGLDQNLVKRIIYQICKAIVYIHTNEMLHRDIKPENILVTGEHMVKVCDFGFARSMPQKGGILTDYVATRWYRSPELLLGCTNYGKEIDYWAIGCIMGEISDGQPMFPGEDELSQLNLIQKVLGPLPQTQLEIFYSNPLYANKPLEHVMKPETLERRYYGKLSKSALSFMKGLLKLDFRERLSSNEVLNHPYFEDLRAEDSECNINLKQNINISKPIYTSQPPNKKNTNSVSNINNPNHDNSLICLNTNINSNARNNKFQNSKNNFSNSNTQNQQSNFSKSPPKEINLKQQQLKIPKKFQMNYDYQSPNIPNNTPILPNQKVGLKTFYNLKEKEDIYNFDIDMNFDAEKEKKKKGVLLVIDEEDKLDKYEKLENTMINNISNLKDVNINSSNAGFKNQFQNTSYGGNKIPMNETRFNRFKPDTGSEFYEEDVNVNTIGNSKMYVSPKNVLKKEENSKNIPLGTNNNFNYLPHLPQIPVNSHRNAEEMNNLAKKTKKSSGMI